MKIPLSRVYINETIKQRILAAVDSQNYILGKECEAFEQELAAHTGVKHCVLASSWTAAVHLLLLALKIKPGDEILTPAHTAFPGIEPIIHVGAKPVFLDVDETYTVNVDQMEASVTSRTVGLLPVHLYGHPAAIARVKAIADKHNLFWIEDCAQAHGATWNGQRVGSHGNFGAFSFFPSKNLTVFGDGGCITTNDAAAAERIRMLRNHGRKDKYVHEMVGFNLRFNEIQAAVGREQLKRLDEFNERRRKAVGWYRQRLSGMAQVRLPVERPGCLPVYHMFVVQVERRDALAKFLKEREIGTGIHYPVPNHRQPAITSLYRDLPRLPVTEALVDRILSLPIHPHLTEDEVDFVCRQIGEFYKS
ncbi:MAG: DegT/DnrJ/EryC1/StrS family aminotransferase [Verrucomicrobia bacterium]|nr:DegT/DnrJ/EryC1/StrS family aminotransferase [Verrucomicrobiota bacterium]